MLYQFVSLIVIICRLMINYVNDPDEAPWRGYFYACLLFVAAVVQSLLLHQYLHRTFVTGMRLKAATIAAVYRKVHTVDSNTLYHYTSM